MKKGLLVVVGSLIMMASAMAQREETVLGNRGLGFSGVWLDWKTNLSTFNGNYSPYYGFAWGLEFGKSLEVGGNHYKITGEQAPNGKLFDLNSNGLLIRYAPRAEKPFHPVFGIVGSIGKLDIEGTNSSVFTVEPSIGVGINVLRWFHVDVDGGYRLVTGNKIVGYKDADFSGAFAAVHLKFGWSWGGSSYRNGF